MAKKTGSKKTPRMSASAARAEGAARQKRETAKGGAETVVHETTVVRGDGREVKVVVPADEARVAAPTAKKGGAPARTARGRRRAQPAATTAATKRPRDRKPPAKPVSLLDAAAAVLREAGVPMHAKGIVGLVAAKRLWSPSRGGRTPHATLHAAMTREIARKGAESRFAKTGRGLFAASGKGA